MPQLADVSAWLSFISHWALLPVSVISVFEATHRLVRRQATKWHIAAGLAGLCVLLGLSAVSGWIAYKVAANVIVPNEAALSKLPDNPAGTFADRPPEERAAMSRLVASLKFNANGVLIPHLTATGDTVTFAPTEQEIRRRESTQIWMAKAEVGISMVKTKAWIFAIAGVVSVLAGFAYARAFGRKP